MDTDPPPEALDAPIHPERLRVPTREEVLEHIDAFLNRHPKMTPTRFGLDAGGEGNLIKSLREGRQPTLGMANRIADFMAAYDLRAAAASANNGAEIIGEADAA